jgi:hypothetical protein
MDVKIAQLVKNGERKEAIALVNEQIQLLKDVEKYDDERGIIALLLRMAENMLNKLKDESVHNDIIRQGCSHKAYMERQLSCEYMGMYDD